MAACVCWMALQNSWEAESSVSHAEIFYEHEAPSKLMDAAPQEVVGLRPHRGRRGVKRDGMRLAEGTESMDADN